ncbi:hypothetical protein ABZ234_08650 [Nocardiopsis sp. NPDC006198]|uniref:hypothetical protein n=1 Tax=Nocardiopsis sp. NPDC006198 TaxID=3154472 RepID=UPI0033A9F89A
MNPMSTTLLSSSAAFGEPVEGYHLSPAHPQWEDLPVHARTWIRIQTQEGRVVSAAAEDTDPGPGRTYRISAAPQCHTARLTRQFTPTSPLRQLAARREGQPTDTWVLSVSLAYAERPFGHTAHPLEEHLSGTGDQVLARAQRLLDEHGYALDGAWRRKEDGLREVDLHPREHTSA